MDNQNQMEVLDRGFVRLDACEADDLSVVNAARVSFGIRHYEIEGSDVGLIGFLLKNRHGTPFEHNMFRFHVKAPIFVFREWQRHRIGSFNELSARYKKLEPEFYVPKREDVRVRVGKPGRYTYEEADSQGATAFIADLIDLYKRAAATYENWLSVGIAPELARLSLPVAVYSEMYWTVNARSLMNFLSLRTAPEAQWEIRQYAWAVAIFFKRAMPVTYEAFEAAGMVGP